MFFWYRSYIKSALKKGRLPVLPRIQYRRKYSVSLFMWGLSLISLVHICVLYHLSCISDADCIACSVLLMFFFLSFFTDHMYQSVKLCYYISFENQELRCRNLFGLCKKAIIKSSVLQIQVRTLKYLMKRSSGGYDEATQKFIYVVLKGSKPQFHKNLGEYDFGTVVNENGILLTYTSESLEILKEHLDVPVIFEDEE